MHKSRKNPLMIVVCAVILISLVAVLPIYCNRENETEHLAAESLALAESLMARDEAAAGDLVDTDVIANREGYVEPEDDETPSPAAPEEPKEDVFVPDRSKMLISYPKSTPRPAPSMIHSTRYGVLETHGDFEGMEGALGSLNDWLTGFEGKISVIAYSLDGKRSLTFNSDYGYSSQCTIKASFIYAICQYMDANAFDENTLVEYTPSNEVPGSGTVQNNPFGTMFTVRDLVLRTLSISDNSAYSMLVGYFGNRIRNECMEAIGAESLKTAGLWGSGVTAEDYVVLWDEIYNYLRTNSHYAQLMKQACTNTPFAYARPVNGQTYSHKSGDGPEGIDCHDICLVWDDESPYILAVMTSASVEDGSHPTIETVAYLIHERLF